MFSCNFVFGMFVKISLHVPILLKTCPIRAGIAQSLRDRRSGGSNPGGGEIIRAPPDRSPRSLL